MTISKELFLAVASLDAYNRGYDAGTDIVSGQGLGVTDNLITYELGHAKVVNSRPFDDEWRSHGFYAVAYRIDGHEYVSNKPGSPALSGLVISYRGTDNFFSFPFWDDDVGDDIWNGYGAGAGSSASSQAHLAAEFYQSVTNTSDGDPKSASVTLTGHSLGGGLAGFVGALYHQNALLFDNMPFESAAFDAYIRASKILAPSPVELIDQLLWTDFYNEKPPWAPEIAENLATIAVQDELLEPLRWRQNTEQQIIESYAELEQFADFNFKLHSVALLTSLIYAGDAENSGQLDSNWKSIAQELWDAFFDADVAEAAGFTGENDNGRWNAPAKMGAAIAYSALDDGERPFGDVAIRGMFNDAARLGSIADKLDVESKQTLTSILVQFAGVLGLNDVEWEKNFHFSGSDGDDPRRQSFGIIQVSDDKNLLSVDLSNRIWTANFSFGDETAQLAAKDSILGQESIWNKAGRSTAQSNELVDRALELRLFTWDGVQRAHIAVGDPAAEYQLNAPTLWDADDRMLGLFVSPDASDAQSVTGSIGSDLIVAGSGYGSRSIFAVNGDDIIVGGAGADYLSGGVGNDILAGGDGVDKLWGGLGNDIYYWSVGGSSDVINDEGGGSDRLILAGLSSTDVFMHDVGGDRWISIHDDAGKPTAMLRIENFSGNGRIENISFGNDPAPDREPDGLYPTARNDTLFLGDGDSLLDQLYAFSAIDPNVFGVFYERDQFSIDGYSYTVDRYYDVRNPDNARYMAGLDERPATTFNRLVSGHGPLARSLDDGYLFDDGAGPGDDVIYGGRGFNSIAGGSGDDTIFTGPDGGQGLGGEGNDTIIGNGWLDGGNGADVLVGHGFSTLVAGSHDRLKSELGSLGIPNRDFVQASGIVDLASGRIVTDESIELIGIWNVLGSNDDDTILGDDRDNIIIGLAGEDHIHGGNGDDTLYGGADEGPYKPAKGPEVDRVYGGAGDDELFGFGYLHGDDGADRLVGGGTLYGGNGDDSLFGFGLLFGDDGDDQLKFISRDVDSYGVSETVLSGGAGNDTFVPESSFNASRAISFTFDGGEGDDQIYVSSAGDDIVLGGAGVDTLYYVDEYEGDGVYVDSHRFHFSRTSTGEIRIEDTLGHWGTDILSGVEHLRFGKSAFAWKLVDADDDYAFTNEDRTLIVSDRLGVLAGDSNLIDHLLSASLLSGPAHGSLTLNAAGSFTYKPDANFSGLDSFEYAVSAGGEALDSATVTIFVNPVNDAPVGALGISDKAIIRGEAWAYTLPAGAFVDVDGDVISYAATLANGDLLPDWLSFDAATRTFAGMPPADFSGVLSIAVTASDSELSASDSFDLKVKKSVSPPVNDSVLKIDDAFQLNTLSSPPFFGPSIAALTDGKFVVLWDTASFYEWIDDEGVTHEGIDSGIQAQIISSDGSKFGGELTVNTDGNGQVLLPSVAALSDGRFVAIWIEDSMSLSDWRGYSVKAQIFSADGMKIGGEFDVHGSMDAVRQSPTIAGLSNGGFVIVWTDASGALGDYDGTSIGAQIFSASGARIGDEFLVNTETAGAQEFTTVTALEDGFLVTWQDNSGMLGDGDATSIKGQIFSAAGLKIGCEFLINSQTNGYQVAPKITALDGGGFVVVWQDGETVVSWGGDDLQPGSKTLGDDSGASIKGQIFSSSGTKIGDEFLVNAKTVHDQSEASVAALDNGGFVVTWEDYASFSRPSDPDIKAQVFNAAGEKVGGEFLVNTATANSQYYPDVAGLGDDSFVITWLDYSTGAAIKAQIFSLLDGDTGSPENAPPIVRHDSYAVDEDGTLLITDGLLGVLGNDTDADSDPLTAVLVSGPAHGVLTLNLDGSFSYTPNANFSGTDAFVYRASDGALNSDDTTVTINVAPVNDAPAVDADGPYATAEDMPLAIGAANGVLDGDVDVDGDVLTGLLVSGTSHGSLALKADGSFVYAPNANFSGVDSFVYRASDGAKGSNDITVQILVGALNDAPTAHGESYTTSKNVPLAIAGAGLLANDLDIEGDALAAVLASGPSHGVLTLDANGGFTYTPDAGYVGSDSFTYRAHDGFAESGLATVSLTVKEPTPPSGAIYAPAAGGYATGGAGDDQIVGRGQRSHLDGGRGSDNINGGDGNDLMRGGPGKDFLFGGQGADTFQWFAGDLDGLAPYDKVFDFAGAGQSGGDRLEFRGFGLGSTLDVVGQFSAGGEAVTFDYLLTNASDGTSQHIFVTSLNGAPLTSSDYAFYGNLPVFYTYRADLGGGQTIDFSFDDKSYLIAGSAHDDRLLGGDVFDSLNGGAGDDYLFGAAGKDALRGGGGADTLTGGADPDTFIFGRDDFADTARPDGALDIIMDFEGAGDGYRSGFGDMIRFEGFSAEATLTRIGTASGRPDQNLYEVRDGAFQAQFIIQYAGTGSALARGDFGFYA